MSVDGPIPERVSAPVRRLWERYYPGPDVTARFRDLLAEQIRPEQSVLEIGSGSGRNHQNGFDVRGKVARYVGVDPDPSVLTNPHLDESYQATCESLPFPDASFDLAFHYHVAEHFPSPAICNREIARVLRPGGVLLFQTPSRFYYASLAAQITPHWFHEFYVRRFGSGRASGETFPTVYRLNDDRTIAHELKKSGFTYKIEHNCSPPGYLRFSRPTFVAGMIYQRTLEQWFPSLRAMIIVIAKKS